MKFVLAVGLFMLASAALHSADVQIDAAYPGGNIVVQQLEEGRVFVAPDQRDTIANEWWFHFNFRLRAPAEKPVTVIFREKNPIGVRGPARSVDGGKTWQWLGAKAVKAFTHEGKPAWSFEAQVPNGASESRYAFCPPYQEADWQGWRARHQGNPALRVDELCRSRKGRSVELARAGCLDPAKAKGIVLLTARHHCCEAMATYAMEGLLESALAEDATGRAWRANWEIIAVPFMDKDGVEDGDQGKFRRPHDHNRDYNDAPLYPEVTALMKLGESLKGRVVAALDLHCPHIRGEWNDRVYFVGPSGEAFEARVRSFATVLERVQQGPVKFRAADVLPFGKGWNKDANFSQGRSCGKWARDTFADALAGTIEIAYADAHGDEVNAASARALGRDLSRALVEHLGAK